MFYGVNRGQPRAGHCISGIILLSFGAIDLVVGIILTITIGSVGFIGMIAVGGFLIFMGLILLSCFCCNRGQLQQNVVTVQPNVVVVSPPQTIVTETIMVQPTPVLQPVYNVQPGAVYNAPPYQPPQQQFQPQPQVYQPPQPQVYGTPM